MATVTSKEAPMEQANGTSSITKAIETNVKEVQEATAKAGKAIEANVKGAQETAATIFAPSLAMPRASASRPTM